MEHMGQESIRTYRYVRVSVVAAVALLFIALFLQIVRDGWTIEASISAYYYSPVRGVFVGALVGAAFSLVAIRGRRGGENALLDLAGMLLPLVAIVPTPVEATSDTRCHRGGKCIPEEFLAGVEVGVAALLILGAAGLTFAGWTLVRVRGGNPATSRRGFAAACGVWAIVAVWFGPTSDWGPRELFMDIGHYAAAIPVFGLIVVVALINARKSGREIWIARVRVSYMPVYRVVAWGMAIVLIAACVYWFFVLRPEPGIGNSLIFWVEAWLLTLFAVFWVAQTAEFWNIGLPEEAREAERS